MSLPAIIVVFFSLGMLGAWMLARPSAGDKRRQSIREEAMQKGLALTTLSLPDLTVNGRVRELRRLQTAYRLRQDRTARPAFLALRTSGESGYGLPEGWVWYETDRKALRPGQREFLRHYLSTLPDWIEAAGANRSGWIMTFSERDTGQVPDVIHWLEALKTFDVS